jgi:hypothetical protein
MAEHIRMTVLFFRLVYNSMYMFYPHPTIGVKFKPFLTYASIVVTESHHFWYRFLFSTYH